MNVVDDAKLQAVGDEVVQRADTAAEALVEKILQGLDGWTLTCKLPFVEAPIVVTLNRPKKS